MKKIFFSVLILVITIFAANATSDTLALVDCGSSARISATPATGWHFLQWNDGNTDNPRTITPTADVSFTAMFAINRYVIVFKNFDGTDLQRDTLDYGSPVAYNGSTPTKPATAQYTYTFSAWNPNIPNPPIATQDMVMVAAFDSTVNNYTVTFENYDGTLLQSSAWAYGQTPVYSGATPVKPADAQYTYTFAGWDKTISPVTGTVTYVAQYNSTINTYVITVSGDNGNTTGSGTYQYGQSVTITASPAECYEFVGWSDGDTNASREVEVVGTQSYVAIFRKIQYRVTVQPDDNTHGSVSVTVVQP